MTAAGGPMICLAMRTLASAAAFLSRLLATLALVATFSATAAAADEYTNNEALDRLFAELKAATDPMAAHAVDQQIWFYWMTPEDPVLRGRMAQALAAREIGDPVEAIQLLNAIVADYPGYAEGWNQRATMYYLIGNFEASIADCAKVLELEPRHFGALSGRSTMYLLQGKRALALKDMAAALALHPFIGGRELFPELGESNQITRI
jgi:tetratricopeptide (TPR) repeat protein